MRDWITPSLFALYLKFLSLLGLENGLVVLPIVRLTITTASFAVFTAFIFHLKKKFDLRFLPIIPAMVLFFIPELIRYGTFADLNVTALPLLLCSLILLSSEEKNHAPTWKSRLGSVLLVFSILIRFQYIIFCGVFWLWSILHRHWKKTFEISIIGIVFILFDIWYNSKMYGFTVFPLYKYFWMNTVGGMGTLGGHTPFYRGFELLWRIATEPVFILIVLIFFYSIKKAPLISTSVFAFFTFHCLVGHKELRYFYGPTVVFSSLASTSLQKIYEDHLDSKKIRILIVSFLLIFFSVAAWRSAYKIRWNDYEIPSKLETFAGAQPDIRGLLTYGWNGIYSGSNYTFYKPLPYEYGLTLSQLRDFKLNPNLYNYVITNASETVPCKEVIREEGGGTLYRCTHDEIARLLKN